MEIKELFGGFACRIIATLCLALATAAGRAQTYVPSGQLSGSIAPGQYYNYSQLVLAPTTSIVPGAGQSVALYIVNSDCVPLSTLPSAGQNYVLTSTPRVGGMKTNLDLANRNACELAQEVQYFDGLGRLAQHVQVQGSPTNRDVVQPASYDQFGREAAKYLPYPVPPSAPDDGSYKPGAISDQAAFYSDPTGATWRAPGVAGTSFPTAETAFELSPLNRPTEQGAPGDNWQLAGKAGATSPGHTTKIVYATNNAASLASGTGYWAKRYGATLLYTYDGNSLYKYGLSDQGSYGPNQLFVTVTKNENWSASQSNPKWNTAETYVDKLGRKILGRAFNYNGTTATEEILSTYYVYDDYGNLVYVLPPGAGPDAGGVTQGKLDAYCYQYRYDGRNRQIGKKNPGQGWQLILYNKLDQVVGTQDSVQRTKATPQWSVTKYDVMGRVVMSGVYDHIGATPGTDYRATLQSAVNSQGSQWESKGTTGIGYTSNCWPVSGTTAYVLNYYDDYQSTPGGLPYSFASGSTMTRGQLVASRIAVLNTPSNMIWRQNYYDDNGRTVKAYQQHFLGGVLSNSNYDATIYTYDFTGALTTSIRQHFTSSNTSVPAVTISNRFIYDHLGRKLKTWQQIQNAGQAADARVLLSKRDYNEIGQLSAEHLHSTDSASYKQDVLYSYNERGWILKTQAPMFEMQLQYNSVTNVSNIVPGAQYNGNVASQSWGTQASPDTKSYTYSYDKLDRMTGGIGTAGHAESGVSYDPMGNIATLNRYQPGNTLIDHLTYVYNSGSATGNQLYSVTDDSGNSIGAKSGQSTYSYNGNGDVTSDASRASGAISIAYNALDLPQSITGAKTITYTYDAAGQKLRRASPATGSTDYVDGIQYDGSPAAISRIQTETGDALPYDAQHYNYEYFLSDHLGNTRLAFDTKAGTPTVVQTEDYYPFGMESNFSATNPKNEYLYNKKELQEELGMYDYGARFYDPVTARWNATDPLAPSSGGESPYSYAGDSPSSFIDADGAYKLPANFAKYPALSRMITYYLRELKYNSFIKRAFTTFTDFSDKEFDEMVTPGSGPTIVVTEPENQNYLNVTDPKYRDNSFFDGWNQSHWNNLYIAGAEVQRLENALQAAFRTHDASELQYLMFKVSILILHESVHRAITLKHPNWADRELAGEQGAVWENKTFPQQFTYRNRFGGKGSSDKFDDVVGRSYLNHADFNHIYGMTVVGPGHLDETIFTTPVNLIPHLVPPPSDGPNYNFTPPNGPIQ